MYRDTPYLQSAPMEIHWAGWKSDTVTLQRHGWGFSQEYNVAYDAVDIVMAHKQARVIARINKMETRNGFRGVPIRKDTQMCVDTMASELRYMCEKLPVFRELDMEPTYVNMQEHRVLPNEVFRTFIPENVEVLVDRADMSVVEHLEAIKSLQAPKQFELREQARRDMRSGRQVVAQLIDYA